MKKVKINLSVTVDGKTSSADIEFVPATSGEYQGKYKQIITVVLGSGVRNTTELPYSNLDRLLRRIEELAVTPDPNLLKERVKKFLALLGIF